MFAIDKYHNTEVKVIIRNVTKILLTLRKHESVVPPRGVDSSRLRNIAGWRYRESASARAFEWRVPENWL